MVSGGKEAAARTLSLKEILRIPGAKEVFIAFFCYCALEQTAGLWASSYLHLFKGVPSETAAFYASMFYIGITASRALSGFLTMRFSDVQMIRMGCGIIGAGGLILLLPLGAEVFSGRSDRGRPGLRPRCTRVLYTPPRSISARKDRRPSSEFRWPAPMWAAA